MEFKHEIDNECAFNVEKNGAFCSPTEIVDKLKSLAVESQIVTAADDNETVLSSLKEKYRCSTESCVLQQHDVKTHVEPYIVHEALTNFFKPTGPATTNEWLSNFNIDSVLKQIEKKYTDKNFLHICFQMRDFVDQKTELAVLDWPAAYNKGKRCFGTVFNTDSSSGRGQHWYSIFGSFQDEDEEFTIEYFNSSGENPQKEICAWVNRVKNQWAKHFDKSIKFIIATKIAYQRDNSSCGAYSLYYIISRLDGTSYEWFEKNRVTDKQMVEFRRYLFRVEE
jgi:hypothetical protein